MVDKSVSTIAQAEQNARPSPWPRRLAIFGLIWGPAVLIISTIAEPTPENLTLMVSILVSGLYTLALYIARRVWLPLLARYPLRNATLLGIANAAIIETVFLVFQHLFGAEGVAAHPNLLIDLLLTMPWYTMMVLTFVRVQLRQQFTPATILLLGAVYETGADGIVGQVIGLLFGDNQLLDPGFWVLLGLLAFWQFIPVYSSMVLPPSWLVEMIPAQPPPPTPAWRDALRPMLWLFPFTIYLLVFLVVMGALSSA